MPHLGSRRMYRYICGCPEASRKEDERLTCSLHHVISRRKCLHSSGTKHYIFNTEIDCIDCVGKSTLDSILQKRAEIEQAESQVAQYHAELCQRGEGKRWENQVTSNAEYEHLITKYQQCVQERDRLMAAWPIRRAKLMSDFQNHYGDWDEMYWRDKRELDEASKPDPGVPSVAWFAGDGDRDFFFEGKAHARVYSAEEVTILEKITGRRLIF
ncbi:MAG: hypothetical protein OHK93_006339 [Ramalina farinacea]|uniref:Uncharacterized protein n=1 Tax=Ramalina farinacea TaxID=258253 RepID=A0AA43QLC3_9LECA|nr:hypothetical protein [Ramalina farinacea]